jgi:Kef-type K+ transport system membrane component KefB
VLAALLVILVIARIVGGLFARYGQSAVLGELLAGVVMGNLGLLGVDTFEAFRSMPVLEILAQFGVLILLFAVGFESDLGKMAAVGVSSFAVAVLGVAAPMALGYYVSRTFFPSQGLLADWFVGATLCATSVGITARVLSDLRKTDSREGRIILGAAVIDDVLGLLVLAVMSGLIEAMNRGVAFETITVLVILGKAIAFLVVATLMGRWLSPRVFQLAARLQGDGLVLTVALLFCFGFAYVAAMAGLAPIVGAFAAGLVLDKTHYRQLRERDPGRQELTDMLNPLATFLVPIFFVLMGMRVDLAVFGHVEILGFAAVLTIVAILGKQVCALGVFERGTDRWAVGLGMIPRGEVGLIFASIGATLTIAGEPVVSEEVYSAVVVMVALTTFLTPPLLTWRLGDKQQTSP